ncbi:hypothetical protein PENPOL_c034G05194 [Penicillium polonicum]
MSRRG